MKDLNDKITGGTLTAAEWNEVPSEIQNVIESLGIALSSGDLNQLGKAIAGYVANGEFYTDSGIVNAYVLGTIGLKKAPSSYTDGMKVRFISPVASTGNTTVNVAGLGVKSVKLYDGSNIPANTIALAIVTELVFDSSNDYFTVIESYPRATKSEAEAGVSTTKSMTPESVKQAITGNSSIIPQTVNGLLIAGGQINQIRDSGAFTMPLANSVDVDSVLVVELPKIHTSEVPTLTRTGGDLFEDDIGTDTNIVWAGAAKLTLTSDGVSKWSL